MSHANVPAVTTASPEDRRQWARQAALAPAEPAFAAWRLGRSALEHAHDDPYTPSWLPLVWWNLRNTSLDDEDRRALRALYGLAWIRHQDAVANLAPILAALENDGVPTLLLGGAAFAFSTYDKPALRPFHLVSLLVPPGLLPRARQVVVSDTCVQVRAAVSDASPVVYSHVSGIALELHDTLLAERRETSDDRGFWERSTAIRIDGFSTRVLSRSDRLLDACLNGRRESGTGSQLWIADAATLLRQGFTSDEWAATVLEADRRHCLELLVHALDELRATNLVSVPQCLETERVESSRVPDARLGPERRDGATRTFRMYGLNVRIDAGLEPAAVFAALAERLPPLETAGSGRMPDRFYQILTTEPAPGSYRIMINQRPFAAAATIAEAVDLLVADLQSFWASSAADFVFIHAGTVAFGNQLVLLPGESGTGKTTLVATMLRAGATYFSDEFAVVDRDGFIHPYPRPLRLRTASNEERLKPAALGAATGNGRCRPRLLLFAPYAPDAVVAPQPLSPGVTLLRLLAHSPSAPARPAETLTALRKLADAAPAWATDRGDAAAFVEFLRATWLSQAWSSERT